MARIFIDRTCLTALFTDHIVLDSAVREEILHVWTACFGCLRHVELFNETGFVFTI